jgi:hypothetical protein
VYCTIEKLGVEIQQQHRVEYHTRQSSTILHFAKCSGTFESGKTKKEIEPLQPHDATNIDRLQLVAGGLQIADSEVAFS